MNVLFISLWYPHRQDDMLGLFVQKHADAVSLYANVRVIYIQPETQIKDFELITNRYKQVKQLYVYYPTGNGKLSKTINYLRAYRKAFDELKKENWEPDIVHSNVLTRTPIIAYLYKKCCGTPYVITEHWTRMLKSQNMFRGAFRRFLARIAVRNAACIMPVSSELKEGLEFNKLLLTRCEIVENVVDNCFYKNYPTISEKTKKQLLNVSCFYEQHKNLFGLLRAVKEISLQRDDFQLILVGTGDDFEMTYQYFESLNFPAGTVVFTGMQTSEALAKLMHDVDAIVQFSNYESAGVVVQEALVSGKAVISTRVGIAPKYITDENGILVDVGNEHQLVEAINKLLDNTGKYNSKLISEKAANEFSYERIGKKFFDIYNQIISTETPSK